MNLFFHIVEQCDSILFWFLSLFFIRFKSDSSFWCLKWFLKTMFVIVWTFQKLREIVFVIYFKHFWILLFWYLNFRLWQFFFSLIFQHFVDINHFKLIIMVNWIIFLFNMTCFHQMIYFDIDKFFIWWCRNSFQSIFFD